MSSTSVFNNLDSLAVLSSGIFAGSALYITIVEVPALRQLGLDQHWRFFPYMYERAVLTQSAVATIAGIGSIAHATRIVGSPFDRNLWIFAGTVFVGMFPYTFLIMLPTNKTIINDNKRITSGNDSQFDSASKKDLLEKWNVLHLVRTVGSVVSFGVMVYGLSRHSSLLLG
jgi:uncharacterized membrane protein